MLWGSHEVVFIAHRYYAEVKETFAALLAKPDVRMPHLTAAMAELLARRMALSNASAAASKPTTEDTAIVDRLLTRIFSLDDTIYKKACSSAFTLPFSSVCHMLNSPP